MHKDPYENMYVVVSGYKDFILHPPTDQPWIPYDEYQKAQFKETDDGRSLVIVPQDDEETVPWISVDPLRPDFERYPNYTKATKIECRVGKGDMLYLRKSFWFFFSFLPIALYDVGLRDFNFVIYYYPFCHSICSPSLALVSSREAKSRLHRGQFLVRHAVK